MGTYFKNEDGQEVGLCPICNIIKPRSHLREQPKQKNGFKQCYECNRKESERRRQEGHLIREHLLLIAGGCIWPQCHMRYPRDFRGNFCLDHIDPRLKLGIWETNPNWIAHNVEEFWSRIAPNLQVLCVHHNLMKGTDERRVGGLMHVQPWDDDEEEIPPIDFNEIKLVLPGFEEYATRLT